MYDVAVKPDLNRMVTSSFTPLNNYKKPLAQMDLKNFGNELLVWDYRERKVLAKLTAGAAPPIFRASGGPSISLKATYGRERRSRGSSKTAT